jgi:hypothetical protein
MRSIDQDDILLAFPYSGSPFAEVTRDVAATLLAQDAHLVSSAFHRLKHLDCQREGIRRQSAFP